jgi:hypothetical protein
MMKSNICLCIVASLGLIINEPWDDISSIGNFWHGSLPSGVGYKCV